MTEGLSPSDRSKANERQRMKYSKQASNYDRASDFEERWLYGTEHRTWACSRATGTTLEVAIGTGLNLPLYPPEVRLVGLDLTPEMLALARSRAADAARPVMLCESDAQALPFSDGTFDTVLSTYSMCTVPDEHHAVVEMKRVLKPGGRLILVDRVRSASLCCIGYSDSRGFPGRGERELTRRPISPRPGRGISDREDRSITSRDDRAIGSEEALTFSPERRCASANG